MSGQQDDVGVRAVDLRLPDDVETEPVGHPKVADDDVEGVGGERAGRRRHAVHLPDEMSAVPEQQAERQPGRGLVVDDEDGGHVGGRFTFDAIPTTA